MKRKMRLKDNLARLFIYLAAFVSVGVLIVILYYILRNGLPHLSLSFITDIYQPIHDRFGILPMIINTLYMVLLTLIFAVPVGIGAAIFLTEYAKQGKFVNLIRFTTEVLAGIPSILYGLFGMMFFVLFCDLKYSILAGSLTLSIMILPTLIRTTEESLKSVPKMYKEGALALGATRLRIVFTIQVPCALSGIATAVVLSIGRIVGESAALIFTSGLVYRMPTDFFEHIFSSGRTLTIHLYQLAVLGEPLKQTFATATVLILLVLILNALATRLAKKLKKG